MALILYTGTKNASSWALRAWLPLRELNIPFQEHVVDIRRPQRYANLAKIAEFSVPGAVPVLVDDGVVIFDSLAVMEYANELGGGTLLPKEIRLRAHARSLVAWVHSGMSELCSSISFESSFYKEHTPLSATETAEVESVFAIWEQELARSGGPFLVGELSLADLTFVPTIRRLLSRDVSIAEWPLAQAWTERMISRQSVVEWMREAESLPPVISDE
ncbi:glutathione S-transferase family protein [Solimicrobium silvestre]|uniref:Glutathione S-transferase n=1 Tax=Solimicrobium silvestre TaxID=2099400 RepID=A0A2S9GYI8_9BURK|nr:glutathione S-transferase family protein [Solimicrobium silvestre]PRC92784.1 Glutathione S-transferase [Solimicrobium silvestre]